MIKQSYKTRIFVFELKYYSIFVLIMFNASVIPETHFITHS